MAVLGLRFHRRGRGVGCRGGAGGGWPSPKRGGGGEIPSPLIQIIQLPITAIGPGPVTGNRMRAGFGWLGGMGLRACCLRPRADSFRQQLFCAVSGAARAAESGTAFRSGAVRIISDYVNSPHGRGGGARAGLATNLWLACTWPGRGENRGVRAVGGGRADIGSSVAIATFAPRAVKVALATISVAASFLLSVA